MASRECQVPASDYSKVTATCLLRQVIGQRLSIKQRHRQAIVQASFIAASEKLHSTDPTAKDKCPSGFLVLSSFAASTFLDRVAKRQRMSKVVIMTQSVTLGALTKPMKTKSRSERHVTYKEPRPWRSEESQVAYQQDLLSRPPTRGKSLYGTAMSKPSANVPQNTARGPTCKYDLSQAVTKLENLRKEHVKALLDIRATSTILLAKSIKLVVLTWCEKIDKARADFMKRWQPVSGMEMKIFAAAKKDAESYLCQAYESYHQRYWNTHRDAWPKTPIEKPNPYDLDPKRV